jgi:alkylation response protein AidB-like acyl-CoA dehydrogenase
VRRFRSRGLDAEDAPVGSGDADYYQNREAARAIAKDYRVKRLIRDAKITQIWEDINQIHRQLIGRSLIDQRRATELLFCA